MYVKEADVFVLQKNELIRKADKSGLSESEQQDLKIQIDRLDVEIKAITNNKLKQLEEKRMTEPSIIAEPEPQKEKKTTIKAQVTELENDCYNYLKDKCDNDTKVLVSLIARLMNRSRIDKKAGNKTE